MMKIFEIGDKVVVIGSIDYTGVIAVVKGHSVYSDGVIVYTIEPIYENTKLLRRMPEKYLINYIEWNRDRLLNELGIVRRTSTSLI